MFYIAITKLWHAIWANILHDVFHLFKMIALWSLVLRLSSEETGSSWIEIIAQNCKLPTQIRSSKNGSKLSYQA